MPRVSFYFDLGSPYAYLAAERLPSVLPEAVQWRPVLLGGLFKLADRSSWALGDYRRRQAGMAEIERRARAYELAPIHWPDPWPSDYLSAMRGATYAFATGDGVDFAMRAFRDAFQHGHDLSIAAHILSAAEHAGIDRAAAQAALRDPQIKRILREQTEAAYGLGVFGVPTIAVDDELFWGDDRLEDAAACLRATAAAG